MCPVCWATALASFAGLIAVSIVAVACTDKLSLASGVTLALLAGAQRIWPLEVPWWSFVVVIALAAVRIGYLVVTDRDRLLVVIVWRQACQIAYRSCPNK